MADNQTLTLPDLSVFKVDLSPYRLEKGMDIQFVKRTNANQVYLEEFFKNYNKALTTYGKVMLIYINAAKDVPLSLRKMFEQLASDAEASAKFCAKAINGLNLPEITLENRGMILIVKNDGKGYGVVEKSELDDEAVKAIKEQVSNIRSSQTSEISKLDSVKENVDSLLKESVAAISGRTLFKTKSEMEGAGEPADKSKLASVWGDLEENNGDYGWDEGWVKSTLIDVKREIRHSAKKVEKSLSQLSSEIYKMIKIEGGVVFERGSITEGNSLINPALKGWRSPFKHNGSVFNAVELNLKAATENTVVKVTIEDVDHNEMTSGFGVASTSTSIVRVMFSYQVDELSLDEIAFIRYEPLQDGVLSYPLGGTYDDIDASVHKEHYLSAGNQWREVSSPNYKIHFRLFNTARLLNGFDLLKTLTQWHVKQKEWIYGESSVYGKKENSAAPGSYAASGVGFSINEEKELTFNTLSIFVGSRLPDIIIRAYLFDKDTPKTRTPTKDGKLLFEVLGKNWTANAEAREIALGKTYTVPENKKLDLMVTNRSGAVSIPKWSSQPAGADLKPLRFSLKNFGESVFSEKWYGGSDSFLTSDALLSLKTNSVKRQEHLDSEATVKKSILELEEEQKKNKVIVDRLANSSPSQDEWNKEKLTNQQAFIEINERLESPFFTIPSKIYAVVGVETGLYYDAICSARASGLNGFSGYSVAITAPIGRSFESMYSLTPNDSDIGSHTCIARLFDRSGKKIHGIAFSLIVTTPSTSNNNKNILRIGDSLDAKGQVTKKIAALFDSADASPNFVGSVGDSGMKYLAFGGRKFASYVEAGTLSYRLMVSSIGAIEIGAIYLKSGVKYTVEEVNISNGTGDILLSASSEPSIGAFNKSGGSGDDSITASKVLTEAGNPLYNIDKGALDIENYRTKEGITGKIDEVHIQLGINDVFSPAINKSSKREEIISNAKKLIDAFTSDNSLCKIILGLPTISGNTNGGFAYNYGAKYTRQIYEANIFALRKLMIESFDREGYHQSVMVGSAGLRVDRYYGYGLSEVEIYEGITHKRHTNAVHPVELGYQQIADCYFSEMIT